VIHVYLSLEHAGKSTATLANWYVDDGERFVDELTSKGTAFERYYEGPMPQARRASPHSRVEPMSPT
jgi:hypothetical protein